jgi:hypothetical protein
MQKERELEQLREQLKDRELVKMGDGAKMLQRFWKGESYIRSSSKWETERKCCRAFGRVRVISGARQNGRRSENAAGLLEG